jgi:hypothetical protein
MKTARLKSMSPEQRAEISASKRFDKNEQPQLWQDWYDFYLNKLLTEIIPASKIPSDFQGKNDGFGQYVRARPFDTQAFNAMHGIVDAKDED